MHLPQPLSRTIAIWLLCCVGPLPVLADEAAEQAEFSAAQLEFFEKQVRPILVARCYQCHSADSKELQGGLRVDSRQGLLAGGDTDASIVPGEPKESLLIDAINYGDIYQMPPNSKLPATEIATLTKWVGMGAPWPAGEAVEVAEKEEFNLQQRLAEHWSWRQVTQPEIPAVKQTAWPSTDLDRFVLAKLEAKGWQPAERADRRTLIRRLYFDLVGLPPEPAEVEAFLADETPGAYAKLVDSLLDSPHFGERWGRHWLDLVRYAESRGHEFDYNAPNAYQYRDYVIRALNADVPYNQFVTEHLAGDLMPQPRTNPETGANESILGTGFWFLGEWVHSPVDIKQDEADRFDNMIDVASKTFLGLTVACARCHDHKFDAIAQSDYYALAGFLQSTTYRQARFQSMLPNQQLNEELAKLKEEYRGEIARATAASAQPEVDRLAQYLQAAREAIAAGPLASSGNESSEQVVIEDFESGTYDGWKVTGDAFGSAPQTLKTIADYQGKVNAAGQYFVNSHNVRSDSNKGDSYTGTLTSPAFKIVRSHISLLVGGGAHKGKTCVNLLVGGKAVRTATGRNNNQMQRQHWNVSEFEGQQAQIEIIDQETGGWGNIGVDQIVQTDHVSSQEKSRAKQTVDYRSRCEQIAQQHELDAEILLAWTVHLLDPTSQDSSPVASWSRLATTSESVNVEKLVDELASQQNRKLQEILADEQVVIDYSQMQPHQWLVDGPVFGTQPVPAGSILLSDDAKQPLPQVARYTAARRDPFWNGLKLAPGTDNDPGRTGGWVRAGQTLRTPTFTINAPRVHYLVRGAARVYAEVDSHRVNQGPLHGRLIHRFDTKGKLQWVSHDLSRYQGHGVHIEFSADGDHPLEIVAVVQGERTPPLPELNLAVSMAKICRGAEADDPSELAAAIEQVFQNMLAGMKHRALTEPSEIELASWLLEHPALFGLDRPQTTEQLRSKVSEYEAKLKELSDRRVLESHTALAMWEGTAVDEHLFIRGNHKTLGQEIPRRTLLGLQEEEAADYGPGSGRLKLARQFTSPENPYASRVMVNRVWHHLLGHGLVPSVDNFGVLGQGPSHPEMLDHLAVGFMQDGWSVKRLIRKVVLSSTYQMASTSSPAAVEAADPGNRLLHRQNIRRLEGEVIRDSILAVSGRLDEKMYGPSVPIHLTNFLQGRGRPGSGPIDGHGRRSIYLSVRRNFLSPMMLAFDTPIPFTTVGRRNVSNVPAQALILLNDPLVVEQASRWAKQAMSQASEIEPRIQLLYEQAFARQANEREVAAARAFLTGQGAEYGLTAEQASSDERVWSDLCHVLFNAKEFIYIR